MVRPILTPKKVHRDLICIAWVLGEDRVHRRMRRFRCTRIARKSAPGSPIAVGQQNIACRTP